MSKRKFELPVLTPNGPIEQPMQIESESYPTDEEVELGIAESEACTKALWIARLNEVRSETTNNLP